MADRRAGQLNLADLATVELDRLAEHLIRAQRHTAMGDTFHLGCFADALASGADVQMEQARRAAASAEAIERYLKVQ